MGILDFFRKKTAPRVYQWTTPGGTIKELDNKILCQSHVLIAGSTGSGKSVFVSNLIYTILHDAPCNKQLILIDPKKVDYIEFQDVPHVIYRATETKQIEYILQLAINEMTARLEECQARRIKTTDKPDVYIIVDEYPDIVQTSKPAVAMIEKISRLGRAAKIHLIICTQRNTKKIINGVISANMTTKVALHTTTEQESRNIIGIPYAAHLPKHGKCIYYAPDEEEPYITTVTPRSPAEMQHVIDWWVNQAKEQNFEGLL